MGKKRKAHVDTRGVYPRLMNVARNGIVSAIGVAADVQKNAALDLIVTLKDESGQLLFVVRKASADTLRRLAVGDVVCVDRSVMGKLGNVPAIVFNGYQRKGNYCSVWSGTRSDFSPKITTDENVQVPHILENRISELRELFSENGDGNQAVEEDNQAMETTTREDQSAEADEALSEMIEHQRHLVMINQACGMNPPPLPPRLECVKEHLSSIVVSKTPTARFVNDIHKVINGSQDTYFNLFAQVVSVHKLRDSFILKVWDGTEPIGLGELPKTPAANLMEDWLELDQAVGEAISPFTLNILCFGTSWTANFKKIKPFDILLLANVHLTRRSLGELSLTMHEGMANRRGVAVVSSEHNKAEEIRRRCEAKLLKLRPVEATEDEGAEKAADEPVDCDLSNLLNLAQDGNETIKTWHSASQSQRLENVVPPVELPPDEVDQLVDTPDLPEVQEEPMEVEETQAEPQVIEAEEAVGPPFQEPPQEKERTEIVEAGLEKADGELYSAMFKCGLSQLYRNPTWQEEVDLAYSLPLQSTLNFHNCLKVDLEKWRRQQDYGSSLCWTMYCNACSTQTTIQAGQSTWCPSCFTKDSRLSQCDVTARVLIALKTGGKRLLLAAFPHTLLKVLYPDITTLSDRRCTAEFNKQDSSEWSNEVISELQTPAVVDFLNKLYCSSTIQKRGDDVCILFITKAISQGDVSRILDQSIS